MGTYTGAAAEKADAIFQRRLALGLMPHGLLAFILTYNGWKGMPKKYLDAFDNAKLSTQVETPLRQAKIMPKTGQGAKFHYRIMRDATDATYDEPSAMTDKANFDATEDMDRLVFDVKRISSMPALLALDMSEIKNNKVPGNMDAFAHKAGQAMIKFLNGLARQLMLGDGTGNNLNGLADHVKFIMEGFGETSGTWTSKTIGGFDQNTYAGARNHARVTAITDATKSAVTAAVALKWLQYLIDYASLGGTPGVFGVMDLATKHILAAQLALANQTLLGRQVSWAEAGKDSVKVVLGRHIYIEGAPFVVDTFTPTNYVYCHNFNVLGIDWKGSGPFKSTGLLDLAELGTGYPIGSVGMAVDFQGNMVGCLPGAGSVIYLTA